MEIEPSSQPETPQGEATWKPEDLRRYLLAVAHNTPDRSFCLERTKFPKHIMLGPPWHETFTRMRAETARDDHERWAMVGVNRNKDRIFISQNFVRAKRPRSGPEAESIQSRLIEADERDIPYLVGDIHSHPHFASRLLGRFLEQDYFSTVDLYVLLHRSQDPMRKLAVMFLVGPNENRAVFRSQETEFLPSAFDQELFQSIWERRETFTLSKPNIKLAKRYQLVLYQGKPGRDLTKVFPKG